MRPNSSPATTEIMVAPVLQSIRVERAGYRLPSGYLGDDRDTAMIVTGWLDCLIRRPNGDAEMPRLVEDGLRVIAKGLDRDRVPLK